MDSRETVYIGIYDSIGGMYDNQHGGSKLMLDHVFV